MTTALDQQSRAAELRATIDRLDSCAKAGKPWPFVPSTASIRAVLDELDAARGLPTHQAAEWFLHTLDNTEGIPGNDPEEKVTKDEEHPFGVPGRDFSAEFPVTSQPVFTAVQAQAMSRVPACPLPCGWDGLHKIAVADDAYLARAEWPEDEEGVSVQRATVMRNIGNLIEVCRAMLAAPRPPVVQERKPLDRIAVLVKIDAVLCKEKTPLQAAEEICAMANQDLTHPTGD